MSRSAFAHIAMQRVGDLRFLERKGDVCSFSMVHEASVRDSRRELLLMARWMASGRTKSRKEMLGVRWYRQK
jgi:hypothetical protein